MKATAIAPANIAFIKYWGKQDEKLHLPFNSSISMNLSGTYTTTTVDFSPNYEVDQVFFLESDSSHKIPRPLQVVCDAGEVQRVKIHLDQIRRLAQRREKAKIMTQNNFPKGGGIASSASGFAALTVAAVAALGLKLLQKELTMLARLGSGSACRSIPAGFVEWVAGGSSETSYAHSLYPEDYWDLRDVILIVSQEKKEVPTTAGMERIKTSSWWRERITAIPKRINRLKQAFEDKDFRKLGEVIEEDCLDMHWVMQTQNPPLFY
ncbi:MAG: diphosphomevalonate decarboxylase [Patescibacteria group bacterium]